MASDTNLRSKVRLEAGETDWHDVLRGVAQGAVESPWLYSCFIDGMAAELKARGLGVMVEGRRVPLLMYADDIVLLASNVTELREMNDVATGYAFKHRFRHNGKKSAVMVFNGDSQTKERVNREVWRLSGERASEEGVQVPRSGCAGERERLEDARQAADWQGPGKDKRPGVDVRPRLWITPTISSHIVEGVGTANPRVCV